MDKENEQPCLEVFREVRIHTKRASVPNIPILLCKCPIYIDGIKRSTLSNNMSITKPILAI